jgi:hypothetical protein
MLSSHPFSPALCSQMNRPQMLTGLKLENMPATRPEVTTAGAVSRSCLSCSANEPEDLVILNLENLRRLSKLQSTLVAQQDG